LRLFAVSVAPTLALQLTLLTSLYIYRVIQEEGQYFGRWQ